jgi:hypothetical protein
VLVAVVSAGAVVFGGDSLPRTIVLRRVTALVLHPPSERDQFFNLVAVDFNQPALCGRIDSRADASSGGWGSPYEIHTLRSACRSHLNLPSNAIYSEVPLWMPAFAEQVRALEYTDADVVQAAYDENAETTPTHAVYHDLMNDHVFRSRVRSATGYGEPRDPGRLRPARPVEYLYQMVAVDASEAELCSKVSPNAMFRESNGATALLQSRCYLSIAFTTRDLQFCDPLPAAGSFPHINENYDSRERCRETVTIYRRPDFTGGLTYGPTPFPHAADFPAILREIGYTEDAPPIPQPTGEDYWEFVSRLIYRGSPGDRAEFLRRVAALK